MGQIHVEEEVLNIFRLFLHKTPVCFVMIIYENLKIKRKLTSKLLLNYGSVFQVASFTK